MPEACFGNEGRSGKVGGADTFQIKPAQMPRSLPRGRVYILITMKKRSKRYQAISKKLKNKTYSLEEAIKFIKENAKAKFDESIDVNFALGFSTKKGTEQQVRGTVMLPHPVGRKIRIAAFVLPDLEKSVKVAGADIVGGEDLINKIKTSGKCDFDIAVAQMQMMPKLGRVAKILGPKGLMPSPKNETVTKDPAKTIKELKGGKTAFRTDPQGCLHQVLGKASSDTKKILDNFQILYAAIKKAKPATVKKDFIKSITLSSTMGVGIKVKL